MNIRYFLLFMLIAFFSCNNVKQKHNPVINPDKLKEPLLNANKDLNRTEDEEIEDYINRYGWNMQRTETGLRYMIYVKGKGVNKAEKGKIAKIAYKVNLINGRLCYDSKQDGAKEFPIGKREVESGLEEGIMLLKVGDKAKLIIPSYLAYGLVGDDNKIPKRATLIYDIELLDIR